MKDAMMLTRFFSVLLVLVTTGPLMAQEVWEEGQLDAVEIQIVKERQISIPKASRKFDKVPPQQTSSPIKAPVEYTFRPFTFQTPLITPSLRPLRIREEAPAKVYNGQLSLGYGSYATPYFDGFINSGRDKEKLLGAKAFYRASGKGPVDGENSAGGDAGVSLYGMTFTKNISASGELGFENRFSHFYGYPAGSVPEGDAERQSYNRFRISAGISNTRNTDFTYNLGTRFNYLSDAFDAQETEVVFDFGSAYNISEKSSVGIVAGYTLLSRKDAGVEVVPRSLLSLNPTYMFYPAENLRMYAGVVVGYDTDTLDARELHVYPDLRITYPLSPSVDLQASLRGGLEKVSLHRLSDENIWLDANIPLFHTNKLYDFQVGVNGRVGNKVSFTSGVSMASLKNWYYYVNGFDDPLKFVPEYDEETTMRTNFFASLGFVQQKAAKFLVRGDVYGYSRENDEEVWYRPRYKVTSEVRFNLYDKLLFDVNLIAQGGMKAKWYTTPSAYDVIDLDAALDLNARMEYIVSDSFSAFVQANNILSSEYPIYLNYPARGLQVLGGLTIRF